MLKSLITLKEFLVRKPETLGYVTLCWLGTPTKGNIPVNQTKVLLRGINSGVLLK